MEDEENIDQGEGLGTRQSKGMSRKRPRGEREWSAPGTQSMFLKSLEGSEAGGRKACLERDIGAVSRRA